MSVSVCVCVCVCECPAGSARSAGSPWSPRSASARPAAGGCPRRRRSTASPPRGPRARRRPPAPPPPRPRGRGRDPARPASRGPGRLRRCRRTRCWRTREGGGGGWCGCWSRAAAGWCTKHSQHLEPVLKSKATPSNLMPKMEGSTMNRISSSELQRQAQWRSGRSGILCRCWASPTVLALDCMQTATGFWCSLIWGDLFSQS
ncbi:hypothetical protein RLOC_00003457 [Lonchura striata]|uniref:Uncharacterized protein n=1 Tax=Lonchura striata TaxID=40157 RepID=A0A218UQ12_9PASE|nr:hypothetical protein RLOC_00003457 [Lonchura striata domestica]